MRHNGFRIAGVAVREGQCAKNCRDDEGDIVIGPAGCFQSPVAQKPARKYLVDEYLAKGLKLSPAQHEAVMEIRHAGTVQCRQLSGVEKRTYNSLEKKGLENVLHHYAPEDGEHHYHNGSNPSCNGGQCGFR